MVWDQRSPVLVMLTRLVEKGKVGFLPHTLCVVAEFAQLCERLKVFLIITIFYKLYKASLNVHFYLVPNLVSFLVLNSPNAKGTGVMK